VSTDVCYAHKTPVESKTTLSLTTSQWHKNNATNA
jgi:hypothetical protein